MGSKPSSESFLPCSLRPSAGHALLSFPTRKVQQDLSSSRESPSCSEQCHTSTAFLRSATPVEFKEVAQLYLQQPVPEFEIHSVEVVHSPILKRLFQASLTLLQAKKDRAAASVVPRWVIDPDVSARFQVYRNLDDLAAPYGNPRFSAIKLFPVWTRARASELAAVAEFGYLRGGGSSGGVRFSCEAGQAWRAFPSVANESDVLILSWVGVSSVFPVLSLDELDRQLATVSNTSAEVSHSYDCYYGPVSSPHNGSSGSSFSEVTILDPTQCLPCFAVKLRSRASTTPSAMTSTTAMLIMSPGSYHLSSEALSSVEGEESNQMFCCSSNFKANEAAKLRELQHTMLKRYESMVDHLQRGRRVQATVQGIPQVESLVADPCSPHTANLLNWDTCDVKGFPQIPPALSLTSAESDESPVLQ